MAPWNGPNKVCRCAFVQRYNSGGRHDAAVAAVAALIKTKYRTEVHTVGLQWQAESVKEMGLGGGPQKYKICSNLQLLALHRCSVNSALIWSGLKRAGLTPTTEQ